MLVNISRSKFLINKPRDPRLNRKLGDVANCNHCGGAFKKSGDIGHRFFSQDIAEVSREYDDNAFYNDLDELDKIDKTFKKVNKERSDPLRLMVGFNRRFAPHIIKMKGINMDEKFVIATN